MVGLKPLANRQSAGMARAIHHGLVGPAGGVGRLFQLAHLLCGDQLHGFFPPCLASIVCRAERLSISSQPQRRRRPPITSWGCPTNPVSPHETHRLVLKRLCSGAWEMVGSIAGAFGSCCPRLPSHRGVDMKTCSRTGVWTCLERGSVVLYLLVALLLTRIPLFGPQPNPALAQDANPSVVFWELQSPAGWTSRPTTVSVRAMSSDGLQESTAEYRYSTDSGANWSGWSVDGLQTHSPVSTTVEIEATTSALVDSATANRMQFRIWDSTGGELVSQAFPIQVDGAAPSSAVSLSPAMPPAGWYSATVTVTISATDGSGSGVKESYMRLDGSGPFQPGGTLAVEASGMHSLEFYSSDVAGNQEEVQTRHNYFGVDREPPTVTAIADKLGAWAKPPVVVTLQAHDGEGSGVAIVEYRLEGSASWMAGNEIVVDGADGSYTYEYRARDLAGNTSAAQRITIGLDDGAPGPVMNLTATPKGWSNDRSGSGLSWDNPSDAKDIAGAYYQIDVDPLKGQAGKEYERGEGIEEIRGISVGSEGEHSVYVWLEDKAGNSNPNTRTVLEGAFRYDATAPYCDERPSIVGGTQDGKYYNGPVRLTFTGRDRLSGIAALHYQIEGEPVITKTVDGGPAAAEHTFSLWYTDTRTAIHYWATDTAGNVQTSRNVCWIDWDPLAPAPPIGMTVSPSGWASTTAFTIEWTNPDDHSGVEGAYYKVGSEPRWLSDGTYVRGVAIRSLSVKVEVEGQTRVYVWLSDRAGNYDHRNWASVTVQRDTTPPETTIKAEGSTRNGYYITPLEISFASEDGLSGVAGTRYRINNGAEQEWNGQPVRLEEEGSYRVIYYSVDRAGNRETAREESYTIDLKPPEARVWIDGEVDYVQSNSVKLRWGGSDGQGSGIESYTVEYRWSKCGPWTRLYTGTGTWRTFSGLMAPHSYYYFRVSAEDRAGHVYACPAPDGDSYVYYEGLANGSFGSRWNGWTIEDHGLGASIVTKESHTGNLSEMAQLSYDWGCYEVRKDAYVLFYQQIPALPPKECSDGLILSFWYRIFSRDVITNWVTEPDDFFYVDTFDVYIRDRDGEELAHIVRDGNNEWIDDLECRRYEGQWEHVAIDLTRWAQQPIRIEFRLDNGAEGGLATWVLIDDVQLLPRSGRIVGLPLTGAPGAGPAANPAGPGVEAVTPRDERSAPGDAQGLPERRPRRETP